MKIDIVRIGRGYGVRFPKALLDRLGFGELAELVIQGSSISLRPITSARAGWEAAF